MDPDVIDIQEGLKRGGLWLVVMGILQVVVGFFAMNAPQFAGLATSITVGAILMFNSLFEVVAAFEAPNWRWGVMRFLSGGLAAIIGLIFFLKPALGLGSLTMFLVFYFLIEGMDRIIMGIRLKGISGRGWLIVGGVAAIFLGVLIGLQWPLSSAWAVGVLVGINLIFGGWAKIFIGVGARTAGKEMAETA